LIGAAASPSIEFRRSRGEGCAGEETLDELTQGWKTAVELAELCGISPEVRRLGYIVTDDPAGRQAWRPDRGRKKQTPEEPTEDAELAS
jgi:hypothetical protein